MKRLGVFLFSILSAHVLLAAEGLALPPVVEEESFEVVIEDVPETADPEALEAMKTTPVVVVVDAAPPTEPDVEPVATPEPIEDTTVTIDPTPEAPVKSTTADAEAHVEAANTTTSFVAPVATDAKEKVAVVVVEEENLPDPIPNCGHSLRPPKGYDAEVLMLQIFLDRRNFSCGVIDGMWGRGSKEAMRAWQASEGLRRTQWVQPTLYAELATMPEAILSYKITEEDVALVTGPQPSTWADRAKMALMGYETIAACLAEKFHTSERTLHYLNPAISNWHELGIGDVVRVPNVRQAALRPITRVVIVLKECLLLGYDAEGIMRLRFPCSIARNRAHLPETGDVTIKNMAPAPNYTYDPSNYGQDASVGKMILPPGPRNPVGSRWIGLSLPGYGIHGTPKPNTVGRPESRGCFRLTNWNVEKLFELVQTGVRVEIVESFEDIANQRKVEAPKVDAVAPVEAP